MAEIEMEDKATDKEELTKWEASIGEQCDHVNVEVNKMHDRVQNEKGDYEPDTKVSTE